NERSDLHGRSPCGWIARKPRASLATKASERPDRPELPCPRSHCRPSLPRFTDPGRHPPPALSPPGSARSAHRLRVAATIPMPIKSPDRVSYKCAGAVHSAPLDDEIKDLKCNGCAKSWRIVAPHRVCVTALVDGVTLVSRVCQHGRRPMSNLQQIEQRHRPDR